MARNIEGGGSAMQPKRSIKIMRAWAGLLALGFPAGAQASETIAYTYDAQGRLVSTTHTGTVNNNVAATYSFDLADNRTNVTIVNAASRVIVVPLNGLTVIPIPDP